MAAKGDGLASKGRIFRVILSLLVLGILLRVSEVIFQITCDIFDIQRCLYQESRCICLQHGLCNLVPQAVFHTPSSLFFQNLRRLQSLKRTFSPLKMDGKGRRSFSFGGFGPIFRVYVGFSLYIFTHIYIYVYIYVYIYIYMYIYMYVYIYMYIYIYIYAYVHIL